MRWEKCLIFMFILVLAVCGIFLIVTGARAQSKYESTFVGPKYATAPGFVIAAGCIVLCITLILAYYACCDGNKENSCIDTTFSALLFTLLVMGIGGAVAAHVYRGQLEGFLKDTMNKSISEIQTKENKDAWDKIQLRFDCCGVDGPQDYGAHNQSIPDSCCQPEKRNCTIDMAFKEGCFEPFLKDIRANLKYIGGVAIGVATIELLGCVFAWCLSSQITEDYDPF